MFTDNPSTNKSDKSKTKKRTGPRVAKKKDTETLTEGMNNPPEERIVAAPSINSLKSEAKERAKGRPLIQKILNTIKGDNPPYKELVINAEPLEMRVALLTDGVLEKFEIERKGQKQTVGAIFKGKIQNLEPGLKAAFVDVGQEKNAFLHYWDMLPAANESIVEIVRTNTGAGGKGDQKIRVEDIPSRYPIGTDIIVQITKAQMGSKGPRTTTNISLPGRYLVLTPMSPQCGISHKIEDPKERDRLKKIVNALTIPEGMGVIVRTASEGKKTRYFVRDLHMLLKKWDGICKSVEQSNEPRLLEEEPDLLERTVRDFLTEDIDRILIDTPEDHKHILQLIEQISPRSKSKVQLFAEDIPIFERFNIERQIEQTFMRRVPLPSGGEIVIEETEALTAIDVNTGSHKGTEKDGSNYILQANLEAAKELARQIRLRNIGGLFIMDFIDMKSKKDRKTVFDCMRQEMAKDGAKTHILPISTLGIMQMTRQRLKESTSTGVYDSCPYCRGRGIVKSVRTLSVEIQRKIVSTVRRKRRVNKQAQTSLRVLLHPSVLERLRTEDNSILLDIEKLYGVELSFRADPAFHLENFKLVDATTGEIYI